MDGFINLNKPAGITSHDAVNRIRRLLGTRKVGHGGTLDPGASWVLLIGIGKATRLLEYLQSQNKEYLAELTVGLSTETMDGEGSVIRDCPVENLPLDEVEKALAVFRGGYEQKVPLYSAVHAQGRRLYELARQGVAVEPPSRWVDIYRLELVTARLAPPYPRITLLVACSKGTYIRSLAQDIGLKLGYGGHLSALTRTLSGSFPLEQSVSFETIESCLAEQSQSFLEPLSRGVEHLPRVEVSIDQLAMAQNGNPVPWPRIKADQPLAVFDQEQRLVGIGHFEVRTASLKLDKVLK